MDGDPDYVLITIDRLSIVARARAVSGCEGTRQSELLVVLLSLGPTPLGARRRARVPCVLSVDARSQSIIIILIRIRFRLAVGPTVAVGLYALPKDRPKKLFLK